MERLFALHNDNPEGLGMVVDELRTIIDGLNQYKKSSGNALFLSADDRTLN